MGYGAALWEALSRRCFASLGSANDAMTARHQRRQQRYRQQLQQLEANAPGHQAYLPSAGRGHLACLQGFTPFDEHHRGHDRQQANQDEQAANFAWNRLLPM